MDQSENEFLKQNIHKWTITSGDSEDKVFVHADNSKFQKSASMSVLIEEKYFQHDVDF